MTLQLISVVVSCGVRFVVVVSVTVATTAGTVSLSMVIRKVAFLRFSSRVSG